MSGPLPPFDWSYTDGKWRCVYLGQRLTVLPNGAWVVSGADGSVSSIGQTAGADIDEAKQRAQGVALVMRNR